MTDAQTESLTGSYELDLFRTRFGFAVRHLKLCKVYGYFSEFDGRGHVDLVHPAESWASIRIDAASIETGISRRDEHLRRSVLLATREFPHISFQSTGVTRLDAEALQVTGILTVRGVSRRLSVALGYSAPETDRHGHVRISLMGATRINRRDWGVAWNGLLETSGVLVSETVELDLRLCIVRSDAVRSQHSR